MKVYHPLRFRHFVLLFSHFRAILRDQKLATLRVFANAKNRRDGPTIVAWKIVGKKWSVH